MKDWIVNSRLMHWWGNATLAQHIISIGCGVAITVIVSGSVYLAVQLQEPVHAETHAKTEITDAQWANRSIAPIIKDVEPEDYNENAGYTSNIATHDGGRDAVMDKMDATGAHYEGSDPGYVEPEPESTYTEPESTYTEPESTYTEPESEYTEPESTYTEPESEYTEPESTYTEPENSYDDIDWNDSHFDDYDDPDYIGDNTGKWN